MKINHSDAVALEGIVRSVFLCDRAGMGGYIDADHFESEPFDAALIALAPLWQKANTQELENFLYRWEYAFRRDEDEYVDVDLFINELKNLVTELNER